MAKKVNKTDQQLANVEQALSKTEQFIETNQKKITYVVGAVVAVIELTALATYEAVVAVPSKDPVNDPVVFPVIFILPAVTALTLRLLDPPPICELM